MCIGGGGGGGGSASPTVRTNNKGIDEDPLGLDRDIVDGRLRDGVSHSVHSGAMAEKAKTNRDQMKAWSTGSNPKAYTKGRQSDKSFGG